MRERLLRKEKASFAISKAKASAEIIVEEFTDSHDFGQLVERVKVEQRAINDEFGEQTSNVAIYITDSIQNIWEEGNALIVDSARKMGIEPHPNIFGVRLEAMNCLSQVVIIQKTSSRKLLPPF